jgi:hypothetical protein
MLQLVLVEWLQQHMEILELGYLLKIIGISYFQSKDQLLFILIAKMLLKLNRLSLGGIITNIAYKFNSKSLLADVRLF